MFKHNLLLLAFLISSSLISAQENLTISDVFHITLSSEVSKDYIAVDTVLVVPEGKLWKISSSKVHMITKNGQMVGDKTYLYLDDQIIAYKDSRFAQGLTDPLWLKPGSYRLYIRSDEKNFIAGRFLFFGYINGIEFDFVR